MHGILAPHARPGETDAAQMSGETIIEADDGTRLKVTFEAAGIRETDVTVHKTTSVTRPVLTPRGVEWELAELTC